MPFNSLLFFLFFLFVVIIYYQIPDQANRVKFLCISNIFFYGMWSILFGLYLILYIFANYRFAISIGEGTSGRQKHFRFMLALFMNVFLLLFLKYFSFALDFLNASLSLIHFKYPVPSLHLLAPLGLSFFTFQNMSYLIDVYRGRVPAEKSFSRYLAYGSFFVTITSGPIVRARQLLPQLNKFRPYNGLRFYRGFLFITMGLFLKMVIADNLTEYVQRVFDYHIPISTIDVWAGVYAYAIQLYTDFAGYSSIAIGLAFMLGIVLPENFRAPYAAHSISEFWKRWHITLSTWIRDYLFLPISYTLSRRMKKDRYAGIRTESVIYFCGASIAMAICGLWHGVAWNYFIWGLLFGVFLGLERLLRVYKKPKGKISLFLRRLIIFQILSMIWVVFRMDLKDTVYVFRQMFGLRPGGQDVLGLPILLMILLVIVLSLIAQHFFANSSLDEYSKKRNLFSWRYLAIITLMWISILTLHGKPSTFVYFRF